jgi:hypothetical protein
MEPWCRSDATPAHMEGLVKRGLLHARTDVDEWLLPDGYVVSFVHFHERGFASPSHRFRRGLLNYYKIEMQHLNPNGIQHITAFVTLCEGYLGIKPHFYLWRYFFTANLQKKKEGNRPYWLMPMGCASIHLRNN